MDCLSRACTYRLYINYGKNNCVLILTQKPFGCYMYMYLEWQPQYSNVAVVWSGLELGQQLTCF